MNTILTCVRNLCCYRQPLSKMDHEIEMTKHELTTATFSNTTPFVPQLNCGKVVKVYHGNTIIIAAKNPQSNAAAVRFTICLRGIEAPQLKTVNPFEKHAAILSRDALHNLIFNKMITLQNVNIERYGRIIADIYLDDLHVNKWMLDNQYVDKYSGGKQ
jgi:hypothetical protein